MLYYNLFFKYEFEQVVNNNNFTCDKAVNQS
jgi:hypothetical protein